MEFKPTSYALGRGARKAILAQFLEKMIDRQDNNLLSDEHLVGMTQGRLPTKRACAFGSFSAAARIGHGGLRPSRNLLPRRRRSDFLRAAIPGENTKWPRSE